MRCYLIAFSAALAISNTAARAESSPATQPSPGKSTSASADALQTKIHALETRINDLQSRQEPAQTGTAGTMDRVVADADKHSMLFSDNEFPSGYDPAIGFVLQSEDGNFSMHPGIIMQFRYDANDRQSIPTNGGGITNTSGTDTQTAFEIRRLRFTLDGNVFSPNLTYFFQVQDDSWSNGMGLLDAYVMYRLSTQSPLALKLGQFKDPLWHEQNVLPDRQLAVDRSLANAFVGGGQDFRVQGVGLVYDQNRLRGQFVLDDGFSSQNTKFGAASGLGNGVGGGAGVNPDNWGASVRAEYLVIGQRTPEFNPFSEYDALTAMGAKANVLIVGGGAGYTEAGSDNVLFHTVDAQYDAPCGLGVYGAYLGSYRHINVNNGAPKGSFYDSAFLGQAGYMVTSQFEPFVRYDYTHLDGKALPGIMKDCVHEITIGANYYFFGQHAKLTLDGSWLPNGSPTDVPSLGILQDDGHSEFTLQAQFQLSF